MSISKLVARIRSWNANSNVKTCENQCLSCLGLESSASSSDSLNQKMLGQVLTTAKCFCVQHITNIMLNKYKILNPIQPHAVKMKES